MNPSQHTRTSSYIPPSSTPLSAAIPRKRNLSASAAVPVRPPPNLRTASSPSTPQPVKEEEDEDDGKDDYGDIGVNTGETPRDEETKKERERLKSCALEIQTDGVGFYWRRLLPNKCNGTKFSDEQT